MPTEISPKKASGKAVQQNGSAKVPPCADGDPEWALGGNLTAAERKEAEIALRRSEERFRTMVEGVGVILWECEPGSHTFAYVSPQAARLGYPVHQWYTENFWADHVHPEDRERAVAFSRVECDAGRSHRFQYRMLAADGRVVWIEEFANIEVSEDGSRPMQERGVLIDITDHVRLTEALRGSESFLRNAIDAMDSHTVVVDGEGKIVSINRSWREFAAENGGAGFDVLECADYIQTCERAAASCPEAGRIAAMIRAVLAGEDLPESVEYACHSPHEQRWFRVNVRGFWRGAERFAVVAHSNITEAKLAAEREASAARREALATIVRGIAHEFNSTLLAAATLLYSVETASRGPEGETKASLPTVARAASLVQRAQVLSASLLELYSTPERAHRPVMELRGWLDGLVERLARVVCAGVSVSLGYDDATLGGAVTVHADPLALEQVVRILLVNASDALNGQGEVRIVVAGAAPTGDEPGQVNVTVTDNGPGVAAEHRARLFDPFFSTRNRSNRSGLGLSVAARLIEQVGGKITYIPAEPTGSSFAISLVVPEGDNS